MDSEHVLLIIGEYNSTWFEQC